MDWKKTKTIMIIFIVIVDILLLGYITYDKLNIRKMDYNMSQTTTQLLKSKGILVDSQILVDAYKIKTAKNVYADNIISNYEEFAKHILQDDVKKISDNEYISDKGKIIFKGDFFDASANENEYLQKVEITKANAPKTAQKYLERIGVNTDNITKTVIEENEKFYFSIYANIDRFPVFKVGINVLMTKDGIKEVYGKWYNVNNYNREQIELKPISGVMVEFMNKVLNNGTNININSVDFGYLSPDDNIHHESIMMTTAWKILYDEKEAVFIKARENI